MRSYLILSASESSQTAISHEQLQLLSDANVKLVLFHGHR